MKYRAVGEVLNFSKQLTEAYEIYKRLVPLDLQAVASNSALSVWRKFYQYSLQEFARKVAVLSGAETIDDFIQKSQGDFDNLALVVRAAVEGGFIEVSSGKIHALIRVTGSIAEGSKNVDFKPHTDLNQFPCDTTSVRRRYEYILERYPYAEQLTLAIIGEDDFLSRYTVNDSRFETVVLEKDQTILTTLRGLWQSKKLHIYDIDIPSSYEKLGLPRAATFITDPPYTLHGALAFIVCGLSMLVYDETSEVEFYVILNASMMGRHLDELTSILSVAGVHLRGVIEDFSAYELPGHFPERKRADQFLQSLGLNTKMNYSSSSNLYRFACSAPDIAKLTKLIDAQRMYEHYSRD